MTHHPHVHMIVPGGGLSPEGQRWVSAAPASSCRCACSRTVPPLFLNGLAALHAAGRLSFYGAHLGLGSQHLRRLPRAAPQDALGRRRKRRFAGPEAVLAYLSRYTHRVAISNSRLTPSTAGVTFRGKNYRQDGPSATAP